MTHTTPDDLDNDMPPPAWLCERDDEEGEEQHHTPEASKP